MKTLKEEIESRSELISSLIPFPDDIKNAGDDGKNFMDGYKQGYKTGYIHGASEWFEKAKKDFLDRNNTTKN